jgi:hypothetical protein
VQTGFRPPSETAPGGTALPTVIGAAGAAVRAAAAAAELWCSGAGLLLLLELLLRAAAADSKNHGSDFAKTGINKLGGVLQ